MGLVGSLSLCPDSQPASEILKSKTEKWQKIGLPLFPGLPESDPSPHVQTCIKNSSMILDKKDVSFS